MSYLFSYPAGKSREVYSKREEGLVGWLVFYFRYSFRLVHIQLNTCPAAFDVSPDEGTSRGVTPQTGLHTCRHEMEATANWAISLRGGLMFVPFLEETELHTGIHHYEFRICNI